MEEKNRYIKEVIIARKGSRIYSDPIKVTIECHMLIPSYWSTLRRLKAQGSPHAIKPDIDNLIKFVYDSLSGTLWKDDRFIVESYAFKVYSSDPRTVIHIDECINNSFYLDCMTHIS